VLVGLVATWGLILWQSGSHLQSAPELWPPAPNPGRTDLNRWQHQLEDCAVNSGRSCVRLTSLRAAMTSHPDAPCDACVPRICSTKIEIGHVPGLGAAAPIRARLPRRLPDCHRIKPQVGNETDQAPAAPLEQVNRQTTVQGCADQHVCGCRSRWRPTPMLKRKASASRNGTGPIRAGGRRRSVPGDCEADDVVAEQRGRGLPTTKISRQQQRGRNGSSASQRVTQS